VGVRAQYHFRSSPEGVCAWDVRRLIESTQGLPVFNVPLREIRELDEPYWCGAPGKQMTCRAVVEHAGLMRDSDLNFPVILSSDGRVMDGMHRICKALLDGRETIAAVRFTKDPKPDHVGITPEELPYDN